MKYGISLLCILLLLVIPVQGDEINLGDGSILVSTGDNIVITGTINDGSRTGYMWLYTGNYATLIYGEPIIVTGNTYKVTIDKTVGLPAGKYKVYFEFAGKNNVPEVLYDKDKVQLYSPWIYVKPVDVSSNIAKIPSQAEEYCDDNRKYCDDTFINRSFTIESPFIKFSDQYQIQNNQRDITKNSLLYVGGETNIDPDSKNIINVTLDYIQTVTATIEQKNPYGYYTWYAHLNISKLRPGDHIILIESNKIKDLKSILTIAEYIPTPKPTPPAIKYVKNEMREFVVISNSPTVKPTSTPMIINNSNQKFVPVVTSNDARDIPKEAPSNAVFISPENNARAPVTTTKTPSNILIVILGLLLSIIFLKYKKTQ